VRKQQKILVVDDEPDLCELLAAELEGGGFATATATSAITALDLVKSGNIDLIVSDIRMPEMDGMTMLKRLGSDHSRVPPVIFVTGYADVSLEEAFDSGAVAIFSKPVDYDALMKAVNRCAVPGEKRVSGKIRIDATMSVELAADSAVINGKTVNVGRGGAFIAATDNFPAVGSKLNFKIIFNDGKYSPLQGTAICRWQRRESADGAPAGFGIEFEELTATTRRNLVALINDLQTSSYIPKS